MQKEKPVSKKDFERTINRKKKARKYDTAFFITRAKYNKLLQQVKSAKAKSDGKLDPKIAKLVKKYDVITADGVERLAVANSNNKVIYVSKDELFSVISQVHLETDHGNLSEMMKCLKSKYKNVSSEATTAYLKLCQKCCSMRTKTRSVRKAEIKEEDESKENKETKVKKGRSKIESKSKEGGRSNQQRSKKRNDTGDPRSEQALVKKSKSCMPRRSKVIEASTRPSTMGTRTPQRIDFIEMENCKDYEYNFIVVLREGTTKFVHLRPLKSHSTQELADILKPIFICFGTPSVLTSSNPDFVKGSVDALLEKCPTLPTDIQIEATEEAEFFAYIETLILSWVVQNSNERWYAGLRFVQYIANLTYNKEIGKTPFEAMFGRKGKLDVSSLNLPLELLDGIRAEEDSEEERDVDINEMLEVEIIDDAPVEESSTSTSPTPPLRTYQGPGRAQVL